jgi:hypothetical protein
MKMKFFFCKYFVAACCLTKMTTSLSISNSKTNRRTFFQKIPQMAAGASLLILNPVASLADEFNQVEPVLVPVSMPVMPSQKPGVIWHAAQQRALPAIPATLQ